jgi:hypothetical protein
MFKLNQARTAIESEGVYIGGWDIKQAIWPRKKTRNGKDFNIQVDAVYGNGHLTDKKLRHRST